MQMDPSKDPWLFVCLKKSSSDRIILPEDKEVDAVSFHSLFTLYL